MRILRTSCVLGAGVAIALASAGCGDNIKGTPAALVIDPEPGQALKVTEGGGSATFTIALVKRPPLDVTLALSTTDSSEGQVSPSTIVFTRANFQTPVTVTVTGVDDQFADGEQPFTIQIDGGSSAAYAEVTATNTDNDTAGITVVQEGSGMTHEAGSVSAFHVVLNTQPTADVTIPVASGDPGEGEVSVTNLVFSVDNWNAPQQVFVSGVDDAAADGPISYTVVLSPAVSADAAYSGVDPDDPILVNVDNDSPGINVTPTSGLVTTEGGTTTATFEVVLTSQPSSNVTLDVSSSDAGEGLPTPAQLTFTTLDWNAPQTVTVTGVNDLLDDGDQSFTIVLAPLTSADTGFNGIDPPDVAVTNIDDESPGFTITPSTGLTTTEAGGMASFTIVLISQPTADVIVPVATTDSTEGTVAPASVTFTPADWDIPQTITVTGVDDDVADGGQPYRILVDPVSSVDPAYDGFDPIDVSLTNTDNDTPGITVTPQSGLLVSELGDTDFFEVVLNSEPTANVTITLVVNDPSEGDISATSLTFSPTDWDTPQRVTVTGVDDGIADGNQAFAIVTNAATSTDVRYNGINPANVTATNFDDDGAQVVVDSSALVQVSENGTTETFTMVLTRLPTANVTCRLESSNPGEGTISPAVIVFTPADFDTPQTLTVTGVDDTDDDGDQLFVIRTNACTSTDPQYNNVNPRDVSARNEDNDP